MYAPGPRVGESVLVQPLTLPTPTFNITDNTRLENTTTTLQQRQGNKSNMACQAVLKLEIVVCALNWLPCSTNTC